MAIARAMMALMPSLPNDNGENFQQWLEHHGQTKQAIDRFWAPVLISALNEELDRISVRYAALVFRDSFLKSRRGGTHGPSGGPAFAALRHSGAIHRGAWRKGAHCGLSVDSFRMDGDSVRLCVGGEEDRASTTPSLPRRSIRSRSCCPTRRRLDSLRRDARHFDSSPITGIHLFFDREITPLEHAVLLERTIQWMFQKSKILATRRDAAQNGSYIELVVSSSKTLVDKPRQEIIDLAMRELAEFFPAVRDAKLTKATVIKEIHATFSPVARQRCLPRAAIAVHGRDSFLLAIGPQPVGRRRWKARSAAAMALPKLLAARESWSRICPPEG